MRAPRVAELVADHLRGQILSGQLADGSLLRPQESLIREFGVSRAAMRDAMRILEGEGLITVQRGSRGGAVVHCPEGHTAAYGVGLVLEARSTTVADVGEALRMLEADCAALCARRPDRATAVVPLLESCNERSRERLDDPLPYTRAMADFHNALSASCGNSTFSVVAGAVEAIWLAHVHDWADRITRLDHFPDREYRAAGLERHEQLTALIAAGDADGAAQLAAEHFDPTQFYVEPHEPDAPISAAPLRDHEAAATDDRHPQRHH
ncbi:MAG: FCD domain-containing protein [Ilumatobacteraceae bacterium]